MAIEHKKRESIPQWFLKAFDQAKVNAVMYPGEMPLVIIAYHQGAGHRIRRFYCLEEDQWEAWMGEHFTPTDVSIATNEEDE